ncbi:iron complex outermembrane receptor protein [Methylosinus sp. sav-2]|uniref:TonB-dependent siderophore receptor n=1 Tax=Methylosinus sp. sav-2 TaxID=2485168 RepID=UPI000479A3C4|nr:TonB-dependent receptor [Methylosinus sp. sav-2]TDX65967.1 iron complex outermembrane receptor protein [Methylosinus sp. sav-2]
MSSTVAAAALGALTIGTGQPAPARAAIPPDLPIYISRDYSISPGSLGSALNSFADKSGLHILYDAHVTRRMSSPGLRGSFSVKDGLDRLLEGTRLSYRFSDDGESVSILLAQADNGVRNDAGAEQLPPIDVGAEGKDKPGAREAGGAPQGPGDRFTGYRADTATSALKMDAPIFKTPVSVQVVTRQTMDDQQAIRLIDTVLTNSSGVRPNPSYVEQYKVRGFTTYPYRNGLQQYSQYFLDTANVQSIEVLKGPAAILYGRVEPGGIIDIVTKRPLETPYYSVQEQIGSYGLTRTTIDATGPATSDKSVLYRVNAAYLHEDSFRDFVSDRNVFVAPTVSWRPTDQFKINIDFEYLHRTAVDDFALFPAVGGTLAQIPLTRYLQQPGILQSTPDRFERKMIAYDWEYRFDSDWSIASRLAYTNSNARIMDTYSTSFNAATGNLTTALYTSPGFNQQMLTTNVDIKGNVSTGPLRHSLLFGYDHFSYTWPMVNVFNSNTQTINIYNPIYVALQNPFAYGPSWVFQRQKWDGVYGQDMISAVDDRVHLLLGGRFDWSRTGSSTKYATPDIARASFADRYDHGFSPRIGLSVQPLPWLSLYGNFTRSLGANNGQTGVGQVLPPQKGEQFEGGVKVELLDKRISATAAYFDIVKTNIPQPDPANSNNSLLIGKVRSRGVEFDVMGRVDDNWSVLANYTHDDVRIMQGVLNPNYLTAIATQQSIKGNALPGNPRNYGNLWVKYDADGPLRGLSVAGGVTGVADQFGDNANSYTLPTYFLLNGMISYQFAYEGYTFTAQLNARNLTDTRYFISAANRTTVMIGQPQSFIGSLRVEF